MTSSPVAATSYIPGTPAMLAARTLEAIGRVPDRRTGVVVSFSSGVLSVSVGGGDPEDVGYIDSYRPVAGDVVVLVLQRSTWVCLGRLMGPASTPLLPAAGVNVAATVQNTSSASFVNIIQTSFNFTKRRSSSAIFVQIAGSAFASNVGAAAEFGVQIAGVTHVLASFFFNTAGEHHSFAGFRILPATPAAGAHIVAGRWRLSAGAGPVNFDANDRISLMCWEIN